MDNSAPKKIIDYQIYLHTYTKAIASKVGFYSTVMRRPEGYATASQDLQKDNIIPSPKKVPVHLV